MNGKIEFIDAYKERQHFAKLDDFKCSECGVVGDWWSRLVEFPDKQSARIRPAGVQVVHPIGSAVMDVEPPKAYLCHDCGRPEDDRIATCEECNSRHVVWRVWRDGCFDWFCEEHVDEPDYYENVENGKRLSPRQMAR